MYSLLPKVEQMCRSIERGVFRASSREAHFFILEGGVLKRVKATVAVLVSFALLFGSVACQPTDKHREEKGSSTVWVVATGEKYHANPHCSNMKSPSSLPLEEAQRRGYEACQKCY